MKTSDVTCLVVDHGLFLPLALRLGEFYKRVLYYSPWEEGFPTLRKCIVGDGYPNVERCDDIWEMLPEIDLAVFPDIQHAGMQRHMERAGIAVWGSRDGDSIELSREKFLRLLKKLGLDVPVWESVEGVTALRSHLTDKEDKFIKISRLRGDMETWHWRSWDEDQSRLDELAVKFGPAKEDIPFLVFDPVETDIEVGLDTYVVDGATPDKVIQGYEWKDRAYLGSVQLISETPSAIQKVTARFLPELERYNYRNFWSEELRVKGDKVYFIDPCCRAPCPGFGAQLSLYDNLGDIIWHGANGELVQPTMRAKFVAEAVLTQKGGRSNWRVFAVPDELRPHVHCGGSCEIDGRVCFPPGDDSEGCEIGWLDATGNTIEKTIETLIERSKLLPDGVSADVDSLADLLKEIRTAEEKGIEFTSQPVPEPSIVVDHE